MHTPTTLSFHAAARLVPRGGLILSLLAGVLFAIGCEQAPPAEKPATPAAPPNVLLITLDTTRADVLGAYGGDVATPSIDRLAEEGTRFAHCVTCVPVTLPAYASILTGTYPLAHGLHDNLDGPLPAGAQTLAETLHAAEYATSAIVSTIVLGANKGLDQGFDTYSDNMTHAIGDSAPIERRAADVGDAALAQLDALTRQHFLLWVHFFDPHYPYESDTATDDARAAYAQEITRVDQQVGRLLEKLDTLNLTNNTLVVLVANHGEGLGDHGESEHGYLLYESTMRVPLIWRYPGRIPAGRVIEPLVRTVDIFPTILDYAQLDTRASIQGINLRPLLDEETDELPLPAYGESLSGQRALDLSTLHCVYLGDWKYIHSSQPELYNLGDDPHEQQNLIAAETDQAKTLFGELETILNETGPIADDAGDATGQPSSEELEQLAALGYVGGSETTTGTDAATILHTDGPSPVRQIEAIELYADALREALQKRYSIAEKHLRTVCERLPAAVPAHLKLAEVLMKQDKPVEAAAALQSALKANPDSTALRDALENLPG